MLWTFSLKMVEVHSMRTMKSSRKDLKPFIIFKLVSYNNRSLIWPLSPSISPFTYSKVLIFVAIPELTNSEGTVTKMSDWSTFFSSSTKLFFLI